METTTRDRLERKTIALLNEGKAVEIYTSITGRILALSPVEPITGSWRSDDYAFGYCCAVCGITSDSEIGCGHYK